MKITVQQLLVLINEAYGKLQTGRPPEPNALHGLIEIEIVVRQIVENKPFDPSSKQPPDDRYNIIKE